jgi:undecaprenyl pyrophosphate phosphatase UppP
LGATAVELLKNFSQIDLSILPISTVIAGSITAALTGILALKLLIKALKTAKLRLFALYCYILALFTAIYLLSKPW